MAGAWGVGLRVDFVHGDVVFGVGGTAATASALAHGAGRRIVDDDFRAAGICGGLHYFGVI